MNILCLIKQVPDTEAKLKVKPDVKDIDREGINMVMNPFDEFAVEEAIRQKEKKGGAVVVITLGAKKAEETVRTALAMGADRAVRLDAETAELGGSDCFSAAAALAAAVKKEEYDLILVGKQAMDDDQGQVGLLVADMLGIPCANAVVKLEVGDGSLKATREIEGGEETVELPLPALITCTKGLNEPRYPSLPGIMKAKKKELKVVTAGDVGADAAAVGAAGAMTELAAMTPPPERAAGKKLEGDPADIVPQVVKALREEAKVI